MEQYVKAKVDGACGIPCKKGDWFKVKDWTSHDTGHAYRRDFTDSTWFIDMASFELMLSGWTPEGDKGEEYKIGGYVRALKDFGTVKKGQIRQILDTPANHIVRVTGGEMLYTTNIHNKDSAECEWIGMTCPEESKEASILAQLARLYPLGTNYLALDANGKATLGIKIAKSSPSYLGDNKYHVGSGDGLVYFYGVYAPICEVSIPSYWCISIDSSNMEALRSQYSGIGGYGYLYGRVGGSTGWTHVKPASFTEIAWETFLTFNPEISNKKIKTTSNGSKSARQEQIRGATVAVRQGERPVEDQLQGRRRRIILAEASFGDKEKALYGKGKSFRL